MSLNLKAVGEMSENLPKVREIVWKILVWENCLLLILHLGLCQCSVVAHSMHDVGNRNLWRSAAKSQGIS